MDYKYLVEGYVDKVLFEVFRIPKKKVINMHGMQRLGTYLEKNSKS